LTFGTPSVSHLTQVKTGSKGNDDQGLFLKEEQWNRTRNFAGANGMISLQDNEHMTTEARAYLNDPNGYLNLKMGLLKVKRWTCKRWKADYYNASGFHSSNWAVYAHRHPYIDFEPYWEVDPGATDTDQQAAPPPMSKFASPDGSPEVNSPRSPSGGVS
jgi:hypothetical protein